MASDLPPGIDIWKIPLLPPPPGVIPNFVDPPSQAHMLRSGMGSILGIMLVFVVLRLWTRIRLTRSLGSDDYLCILATACVFAYSGLVLSFIGNPEGKHGWDIPLGEVLTNHYWLEATMASVWVYCWATLFVKLTLLVLYLRIFRPSAWGRWPILITIALISGFYVATFAGYVGICAKAGSPLWETIQDLNCANNSLKISKAQGWFGLFSDLAILIIPLPLVWQLSLTSKRKVGVMAVFLTGLAACIVSAVALAKRYSLVEQGADRTWENSVLFLYCTLELSIGIICSCMPVMAVVLKGFMTGLNQTWNSVRNLGTRLLTGNRSPPVSGQVSKIPSQTGSHEQEQELPDDIIPSGNVTGLRSFIRRLGRTNNDKTVASDHIATVDTVNGTDETYHVQLKKMYDVDSTPPSRGGQSSRGTGKNASVA
ncbi:hypothetical protein B0T24DRAFT_594375 [Lasiosphaeria ovina]|uniref:Rhodopsin domain-containing protein n=1 Tax=Lasiosphaeria ovina TaxID=92902 RepID=A0AAE0KE48_9PEZI|nr:hypothetical protein B0T24DRAFT_594375 [Lasiosphaeria ovina]